MDARGCKYPSDPIRRIGAKKNGWISSGPRPVPAEQPAHPPQAPTHSRRVPVQRNAMRTVSVDATRLPERYTTGGQRGRTRRESDHGKQESEPQTIARTLPARKS